MTKVSERKTRIIFETDAELRSWGSRAKKRRPVMRSVIVEADKHGWHGSVRLKGTRQAYSFSWEGLYLWAVEQTVAHIRDQKKKAKEARKKGARR